jgi:hypothetical protein
MPYPGTVPGIDCVPTDAWADGTKDYECPFDGGTDVRGMTRLSGGWYDYRTSQSSLADVLNLSGHRTISTLSLFIGTAAGRPDFTPVIPAAT